ncbi:Ferric enterobactin transport ATP-binding protein FepC [Sphingomonas sp. S2M10]|uniref:ABC transporter ATP-binding protein n=1 Tax=Sphingomonas sp. S2M10 TaxID=2705010 RepID=UPI00145689F9|nr:ABC transporter ATP-binding protein [Sphingomonas sp. S2M10]NLS26438.1 Ferric enterobactin transport ATP-binding protein FepC [Sphingomonas sp. S2M10]
MELSVSDLAVSLGTRRVLHGVDAMLRPGRVTAILGPNGSGKSTLVRTLAGLLDPDAGQVKLGGKLLARLQPRERARRIGYLPQEATVHWDLRVAELIALGRAPHRAPFAGLSGTDQAAIDAAIEATAVRPLVERRVTQLSGGERARVLLGRVLAGAPDWLLADEPLASLDPVHQLDLLDRLRTLAAGGMGVVIVLHDLLQAARAADDVLLLREGRVVAFGPAEAALAHQPLREAFGVEVMVIGDDQGRLLPVPIGRTKSV